jgi:ParB family chromosome partitioning protein
MNDDVKMIPIREIGIPNPRHRDKKKFQLIVESIKTVGLKKPIQVKRREPQEQADGRGYQLVCGQGRIEAFMALGYNEIPAIVEDVSDEELMLRSLVENVARRFPMPAALMAEIERLKDLGYANTVIGEKLGIDNVTVGGFLALKKAGEERLLDAALGSRIPLGVAMEIAKANDVDTQRELLKAYESKQLNYDSIRAVKRLIDQRRFIGKQRDKGPRLRKSRASVESLVNAYKRESQRQRLLIKKAKICDAKLLFVVTAFNKILGDENFVNLLRAESLSTMPKYLSAKLGRTLKETA